jgi:anti-sigma factor RsiW
MVDAELPEKDIADVEAHLAHCQQCSSLHDQLLSETRSISTALAVSKLEDIEIQRLERRMMQHIAPPFRGFVMDRLAAFTNQLSLIALVLVSCSMMMVLQFDTAAIYEKIVQDSTRANALSNMACNIGITLLIAIVVVFWNRVGWLFTKVTKGGFRPC